MNKYLKLLFIFIMLFGLFELTEGKFKISTLTKNIINQKIEETYKDIQLIDEFSKNDVIVYLYQNNSEYLIVECSQNLITKLYSIDETIPYESNEYYSVVSSSIYNYAYDIKNNSIKIHDGQYSLQLYHSILCILVGTFGIIALTYETRKGR